MGRVLEREETTALLRKWKDGDDQAYELAFERIYSDLRRTAQGMLRAGKGGSLQATGLVHDAYLRLVDQRRAQFADRQHFLAIAATVIRRLLIDHARSRGAAKRGSGTEHVPFEEAWQQPERREGLLLEVDDALRSLEATEPSLAKVVEMRFFVGFTLEEIAEIQGVSLMTVRRRWMRAKERLYASLDRNVGQDERRG